MAFNTLWYSSQLANTAFLLAIFCASTWTGSTFYFGARCRWLDVTGLLPVVVGSPRTGGCGNRPGCS